MLVVHVDVRVKPEYLEAFRAATIENAGESIKEPGVFRFDVVCEQDDPCHFVLVEIYRDTDAAAAHKQTAHYKKWAQTVASMMAAPRNSVKYRNLFPSDWK